jgi:hypothetical protein
MMRIFLRLSLFIGLLILSCVGLAQEADAPAPWPPNPEDIFAEGVEWSVIEYEIADGPVKIDNERKIVRVLETETNTWREYPSPVADRSLNVGMRSDGLVNVWIYNEIGRDPLPGELFVLDPETGVYTEPPTVCEGKVIQADAGEGKWVAAHHDEAETQAFLCQSETGEQREVLPQDLSVWRIYPNPSGTQLVAIGQQYRSSESFELYAYNLVKNTIISLGEMSHPYEIYVSACDWLNDTTVVLCSSGMQSWLWVRRVVFDIAQENGLQDTLSGYGWDEDTIRLEDPVRYISASVARYSGARTGTEAADLPCTVSVYDATGPHEHQIGTDCIPILIDPSTIAPFYHQGNSLYFLVETDRYGTKLSTLTRYDIENETTTQVGPFEIEIENIVSVSPDERYVVLLMDDNNVLDFPWETYPTECCQQQYGWFVTIIDSQTDDIVYLSERLGIYSSSDVTWLDNETVVIASGEIYIESDGFPFAPPATLRKIHLGDPLTSMSMTISVNLDSPNDRYGVDDDNTVIDLNSFEPITLFQDDVLEAYSVYIRWDEETGDLVVSVSLPDDSESSVYRVTLP